MLPPIAQGLLDAIQKPCVLVDSSGALVAANRAASLSLAQPLAKLRGQPLEALFAGASEPPAAFLRRCLLSGSPTLGALAPQGAADPGQVLRVEGTRVAGEAGAAPLVLLRMSPRHTLRSRFVGLNQRLEELRREVARRMRAETALAGKLVEMERADRQKDRFIALLSHELRNPLAPIRALVHLLKIDPRAAQIRPNVEVMERHVLHLIRLVDDLLDLSRIATGKIRIAPREVDLAEVIELAGSGVRPQVDAKQQQLVLAAPAGLSVRADADRLRQVFGNLLDNASKFTPRGGRIEVRATPAGDRVEVRVIDSGPGIPPAIAPKVFDFFMQGDIPVDPAHNGLGIGLALARSLAELQGGSVALAPPAGEGAEFVVTIPLAAAATAAASANAALSG
jgi:signal transduction histidine kinase